jgi:putative oxidoreductase
LQRLFATFPEGWPGTGLVLLRVVTAIPPVYQGIAGLLAAPLEAPRLVLLAAAFSAALLLVGLWTPVAGVLMALLELCVIFTHPADPWMHAGIGTLGAALAMLGPGAWSADARLFGRKRIEVPRR